MKVTLEIQYRGFNVTDKELIELVKADIKKQGVLIKSVQDVNIYYIPELEEVYYFGQTKEGKVDGKIPL